MPSCIPYKSYINFIVVVCFIITLSLPIFHLEPKDMPRWWTMTGRPDQRNAGYMDPLMSLGAMNKILFLVMTNRELYYI